MKLIPLTRGHVAKVDDCDFDALAQFKWMVLLDPKSTTLYAYRRGARPKRERIWMHRVIINAPSGAEVDHADHDGLNNTRANLRCATHRRNMQNQRKRSDNTGEWKGVARRRGGKSYEARIQVDGAYMYLGSFATAETAARAYDAAAALHFGEFATLNFPIERKTA